VGAVPRTERLRPRVTRLLNDPRTLLFATAFIVSMLVAPGWSFGVSDTPTRLEAAHWMWTGHSPLPLDGPPGSALIGRHGLHHPWYGAGQSLLLLPFDVVFSTVLGHLRPSLDRSIVAHLEIAALTYSLFPVINALVIVVAFDLLRRLRFSTFDAAAGALSLLVATTFLWHCQNYQENPLLLLLALWSYDLVLRWRGTGDRRLLHLAFAAAAFRLVVRVPAFVDLLGVIVFPVVALWTRDRRPEREQEQQERGLREILVALLPVAAGYSLLAVAMDRVYQWIRFATWSGTYIGLFGQQMRALHPDFPATYPFDNDFVSGLVGPFVSLGKSVFVYDPLFAAAVLALILGWRSIPNDARAFVLTQLGVSVGTAAGYATYYDWGGASAWGDRFLTTPVHAAALLAVPMLLRLAREAGTRAGLVRGAVVAVVGISTLVQIASLVHPSWIEELQAGEVGSVDRRDPIPFRGFYLGLRLENLAGELTGSGLAPAADGARGGVGPMMLLPLQPLQSFPRALRGAVYVLWYALLALALLAGSRVLRQTGPSSRPSPRAL
jgi:hypothetical protein